jgi:hypothetical protein
VATSLLVSRTTRRSTRRWRAYDLRLTPTQDYSLHGDVVHDKSCCSLKEERDEASNA